MDLPSEIHLPKFASRAQLRHSPPQEPILSRSRERKGSFRFLNTSAQNRFSEEKSTAMWNGNPS